MLSNQRKTVERLKAYIGTGIARTRKRSSYVQTEKFKQSSEFELKQNLRFTKAILEQKLKETQIKCKKR